MLQKWRRQNFSDDAAAGQRRCTWCGLHQVQTERLNHVEGCDGGYHRLPIPFGQVMRHRSNNKPRIFSTRFVDLLF
jgi:hypothetical protein